MPNKLTKATLLKPTGELASQPEGLQPLWPKRKRRKIFGRVAKNVDHQSVGQAVRHCHAGSHQVGPAHQAVLVLDLEKPSGRFRFANLRQGCKHIDVLALIFGVLSSLVLS